ncbi:D-2-hydroxyacid dehydrogenase family protein [Pseudonocardia kunmingensis]|uniref:Lactate dehydrogenase-like 2-hydroxyacid dehydrogenase n=1 Tax=Pseudonocardia kunmingensis TaxID=630975 RepID=A0A543DRE9_9PSEU|nr:D-2-hydroxyacid dehydrogenase family protein [Pseudonocardia kunmingensis]TQM11869.1 lactate dehydrogenase-like 2-hydroxyacid dehydrogenase [Pseudonocardia kunmingensis]
MSEPTRVVVLDDYLDAVTRCADWSVLPADVVTVTRHIGSEDELVAVLCEADVVVATRERTRLGRSVLERLPRLRLLVTTAMRNAAIDLDAATERGVLVCGTRGNKRSTVELTWGLVLALLRDIPGQQQALREGRWHTHLGVGLEGKTLGLLGLGTTGSQMAAIARAFDMDVLAWSANLTAERAAACGARRVERDELLARADVVSVHLVLSERTRGLVGARELALMRPTSYLVNTSRAAIVDQTALVTALENGAIAGAAADVFEVEPAPAGTPLLAAPRTVLTPHIGYVTAEEYRLFYGDVVDDIAAWLAGAPVRTLNAPAPLHERKP